MFSTSMSNFSAGIEDDAGLAFRAVHDPSWPCGIENTDDFGFVLQKNRVFNLQLYKPRFASRSLMRVSRLVPLEAIEAEPSNSTMRLPPGARDRTNNRAANLNQRQHPEPK